MKQFILSCVLSVAAIAPSQAQQTTRQLPVYLDQTKPVEQRIDDAISRMTLAEKIRIIHAQSKFHQPVYHAWDFLTSGRMTDLTECVLTYCGMSGNRLVRPTTPV